MSSKPLILVFFGTPEFSVASLDLLHHSQHKVAAVVTAPDKPAGRGMQVQKSAVKQFAEDSGIPVLQPKNMKNPDFQNELRSVGADLFIVIAFRMMPEAVWNMPPMGTINLHASYLPAYRGAAPINWAVINGEAYSGVTTFRLKHEIDTGDLLMQKKIPLESAETAGSLHDKLMSVGAELVMETVNGLAEGSLKATVQEWNSSHPKAPKIFKADCVIDFDREGKQIIQKIRGLNPFPTARCEVDSKTWLIYRAHFIPMDHTLLPGTVIADKSKLWIACKDGYIAPEKVKPQGKRQMKIKEVLNGWNWKAEPNKNFPGEEN